jgi:hypothetical protein
VHDEIEPSEPLEREPNEVTCALGPPQVAIRAACGEDAEPVGFEFRCDRAADPAGPSGNQGPFVSAR